MTPDEIKRACMKVIELLPSYAHATKLMEDAAFQTLPDFYTRPSEGQQGILREIYKGLKDTFQVVDIDDHVTKEDLELLAEVHDLLAATIDNADYPLMRVEEALEKVKKVLGT